tara:strand:- start:25894 stop:26274 length:381 start_codon:yes stop_codon:yes gene_type:complete
METEVIGINRNPDGTFPIGNPGGPGRPPETEEQKIVKKAIKEIVKEYKEGLAEALPNISPILVAKAMNGDIAAIKEIHDRTMDKAPIQQKHTGADGGAIQTNITITFEDGSEVPEQAETTIPTEEV